MGCKVSKIKLPSTKNTPINPPINQDQPSSHLACQKALIRQGTILTVPIVFDQISEEESLNSKEEPPNSPPLLERKQNVTKKSKECKNRLLRLLSEEECSKARLPPLNPRERGRQRFSSLETRKGISSRPTPEFG